MAVRFDTNTDRLLRTANLPTGAFTIAFWVNLISDLNAYQTFWYFGGDNYGGSYAYIGTNSTGTTLINAAETTGSNLSVSTWYYVAYAHLSGASNRGYTYLGSLSAALAQDIQTGLNPAQPTTTRFEFGATGTGNNDRGNIRIAHIKLWTVQKTLAELQREMWQIMPVDFANLAGWWPCLPGATERLADYSGLGRNFTAGGTLTDEDGPPIAWGGSGTHTFYYVGVSSQTISPGGIATLEAFGTAQLAPGPVSLTPGGIATLEAFGSPIVNANPDAIVLTGIASAEAFGSHTLAPGGVTLAPGGVATGEAFGAGTITPGAVTLAPPSITDGGYALRFYGHGSGNIDRVWLPLESGGVRTPIDLGGDFTYEFWIKCRYADNDALVSDGDTRYRNAILDRDIWGDARGWTFAVARSGSNLVCGFAIAGSGLTWTTITGTANVGDDAWHHIALVRRGSDGLVHIYVDGTLDASGTLYSGNLQHTIGQDDSPITGADYQLVIGAEKHDAGSAYPSYNGHFDDFRISNTRRYTTGFTAPSRPLGNDANTVGLYHCDQGSGTTLTDSATVSGAPTNGTLRVGGSAPAGPVWVAESETVGIPTVLRAVNLLPGGIATLEAFGSHTLTPGAVSLLLSGIATGEAIGAAQLAPGAVSLVLSGIATGGAFGSTTLTLFLTPGGIASAEALGTALLRLTLTPGAIATAEAFGTIRLDLYLAPGSIAGGEAFGVAVLTTGSVTVGPGAISSGEAFGGAIVTAGGALIQIAAIASGEAFGSVVFSPGQVSLLIGAIGSGETFGSPVVTAGAFLIQASAIASGEVFGALTLTPGGVTLQPGSIAGGEAFGSAQLAPGAVTLALSGIGSGEVVGSAIVTQGGVIVVPVAIATGEAFGSGQITTGPVTVQPVAIGSGEIMGSQTIYVVGTIAIVRLNLKTRETVLTLKARSLRLTIRER